MNNNTHVTMTQKRMSTLQKRNGNCEQILTKMHLYSIINALRNTVESKGRVQYEDHRKKDGL